MDETPIWLEMPPKSTIDVRGSKKVAMLITGYTSARITAVLCCSSEGRKINPLILASKTTLSPIDRKNVLLNSSGYMTEDVMISWISDYFLPSIVKRNNIFVRRVEKKNNCWTRWNRDVNGARNIRRVFLHMNANGGQKPEAFRRGN
jgi:hypothetical protein